MKNGKNRLAIIKCLIILAWGLSIISNLKIIAENDNSSWRLIIMIPCTLLLYYFLINRGN